MLDIFADTFHIASRSTSSQNDMSVSNSDTNRRYPWRGNRWTARRKARTQIRRLNGMSDHMLADLGITRNDINRMFD